ncbi:hypothetical protein VKT23_002564 [Stygiomarasmius scandens]|uniref:Uncharacterized protein n=1 Tax=Marasmiellus scandens TaxID=2682957 RepID=A0ABR1K7X8_9AGAR
MPGVEFLFVDTFLYTIPDTQDDISTSSSQASSPSSSIVPSSFPSTTTENKLPIILGTVLGALLLLCIMAVLILYRKTQELSLIVTGSGTGSTAQLRILTSPLNSPESDEPKPVTLNPLAVFHRNSDAVTPFPLNARPSGLERAGSQSVLSSPRTGATT